MSITQNTLLVRQSVSPSTLSISTIVSTISRTDRIRFQEGVCQLTPKPLGTPCGNFTNNGCSRFQCNGNHQCENRPWTAASGTQCSSSTDPCVQNLCHNGICTSTPYTPIPNNCTGPTPPTTCKAFRCSAGTCQAYPPSNSSGAPCSELPPPNSICVQRTCVNMECQYTPASVSPNTECQPSSDPCTYYRCSGMDCVKFTRPNGTVCGTTGSDCTQAVCRGGVCTVEPFNIGGQCTPAAVAEECTRYECNSSGACVGTPGFEGQPCGGGGTPCVPLRCTGGTCAPQPVDCSALDDPCSGPGQCVDGTCQPSWSFNCRPTASTPCCNPIGQPNQCNFSAAGTNCASPNADPCTTYTCDGAGNCIATPVPDEAKFNCSSFWTSQHGPLSECSYAVCRNGTCQRFFYDQTQPCSGSATSCLVYRCNGAGVCLPVAVNENGSCSETPLPNGPSAVCNVQRCQAGVCRLFPSGFNGSCQASSDSCTSYRCVGTTCSAVFKQDGTTCGTSDSVCREKVCVSGVCTERAAASQEAADCSPPDPENCRTYRCRNGTCDVSVQADGVRCGDGGTACEPRLCVAGVCTVVPVDCSWASTPCGGPGVCVNGTCKNSISYQCEPSSGPCCQALGEPNQCNFTEAYHNCSGSDPDPCTLDLCTGSSAACNHTVLPNGTDCGWYAETLLGHSLGSCRYASCVAGVCTIVNRADGTACLESNQENTDCTNHFCDEAGECVPRAVNEGASCAHSAFPEGPDGNCNRAICEAGVCVLDPINVGLECNLSTDFCTNYRCSASGTCDALRVPDGTSCGETPEICTTLRCLAGTCVVTPTNQNQDCTPPESHNNCSNYICDSQGNCVETSKSDGVSCGGTLCEPLVCISGACRASPVDCSHVTSFCGGPGVCDSVTGTCHPSLAFECVPSGPNDRCCNCNFTAAGTNCAPENSDNCTLYTCDGAGSCVATPLPDGTDCTGYLRSQNITLGECYYAICQAGYCTTFEHSSSVPCTPPPGIPYSDCVEYRCVSGSCTATHANENGPCEDIPLPGTSDDACLERKCIEGSCQFISVNENVVCADWPDNCTEFRCVDGSCTPFVQPSSTYCGESGNECQQLVCEDGRCTLSAYREGLPCTAPPSSSSDCLLYRCQAGVCTSYAVPDGQSCQNGGTNCVPLRCAAGVCKPHPVDCSLVLAPSVCGGSPVCNPTTGQCQYEYSFECIPQGLNDRCCNCNFTAAGTDCAPSNADVCTAYSCDGAGNCVTQPVADGTDCSAYLLAQNVSLGECFFAACQSGVCTTSEHPSSVPCTPPPGVAVSDCVTYRCDHGECKAFSDNDGLACDDIPLPGTPDDACLERRCNASTCIMISTNEDMTCDSWPDSCSSLRCKQGHCTQIRSEPGTTCGVSSEFCTQMICGLDGRCHTIPANEDALCTPLQPPQLCREYRCRNGNCSGSLLPDGTACNGGGTLCAPQRCAAGECVVQPVDCTVFDFGCGGVGGCNETTGQCQASLSYQCIPSGPSDKCCNCNYTASGTDCTPSNADFCTVYTCDGLGNCVSQPLADGTNCSAYLKAKNISLGECYYAECRAGVCVRLPHDSSKPCTGPNPNTCTGYHCVAGECLPFGINDGAPCTEGSLPPPPHDNCRVRVCNNTICRAVPAREGEVCLTQPDICTTYACKNGFCSASPLGDGTSCGVSSDFCLKKSCLAGVCVEQPDHEAETCDPAVREPCHEYRCIDGVCEGILFPEEAGCISSPNACNLTSVGADCRPNGANDPCTTYTCDDTGNCIASPVLDGVNCTDYFIGLGSNLGQCKHAQCEGGRCVVMNLPNATTCGISTTCQIRSCQAGQCVSISVNEGDSCTEAELPEGPDAACKLRQCTAGQCLVEAGHEGEICATSPDECTTFLCASGFCVAEFAPDGSLCGEPTPSICQRRVCLNGTCQLVPHNIGADCSPAVGANLCSQYRCSSSGTCQQIPLPQGQPCDHPNSTKCTPYLCIDGLCVPSPVNCSTGEEYRCGGPRVCDEVTGQCRDSWTFQCNPSPTDRCCNPVNATSGACNFTVAGTDCRPAFGAEDPCTTYACDGNGACLTSWVTDGTDCSAWLQSTGTSLGQCYAAACNAGRCQLTPLPANTECGPPAGENVTTCRRYRCTSGGSCTPYSVNDTQLCTEGTLSGPNAACNELRCSAGSCVPHAANNGAECQTSNDSCTYFQCVNGVCRQFRLPDDTPCGAASTNICQKRVCVAGTCSLVPTNVGGDCTPGSSASQCAQYFCDSTGTCQQTPKNDGAPCNGGGTLCSPLRCQNGLCVNQTVLCDYTLPRCGGPRVCNELTGQCQDTRAFECIPSPTDKCCNPLNSTNACNFTAAGTDCRPDVGAEDPCTTYACDGAGTCVASAIADGTNCTSYLLTQGVQLDECSAGVCVAGRCEVTSVPDSIPCRLTNTTTCRAYRCASGTCSPVAINDSAPCTEVSLPPGPDGFCYVRRCSAGICTLQNANNGVECQASNDTCSRFVCSSGRCTAIRTPDDTPCGENSTNVCQKRVCSSGVCSLIPDNIGRSCTPQAGADECLNYLCDTTGTCQQTPRNDGVSCQGGGTLCAPRVCQSGVCVQKNVSCTPPFSACGVPNVCDPATGQCRLLYTTQCTPSPGNKCCNPYNSTNACNYTSAGTDCRPDDKLDICTTYACDGSGACISSPLSDGTNCTSYFLSAGFTLGECQQAVCSAGKCTAVPRAAGISCGGNATTCRTFQCDGAGACVAVPQNDNATCTEAPLPPGFNATCNIRSCSSGQCVVRPANEGVTCRPSNDSCTYYQCRNGQCRAFTVADSTLCGVQPNSTCLRRICLSGVCQLAPANVGQSCTVPNPQPCLTYSCSATGNCTASPRPDGISCNGGGTLCVPLRCRAGVCVAEPVNCSSLDSPCSGPGVCDPSTGTCKPSWQYDCTPGPQSPCCIPLGQPGQCNFTATNSSCTPPPGTPHSDDPCRFFQCTADGKCEPIFRPDNTTCTEYLEQNGFALGECQFGACRSGVCVPLPYDSSQPCTGDNPSTCQAYFCSAGTCRPFAQNEGQPCTEASLPPGPSAACKTAVCFAGQCVVQPDHDGMPCGGTSNDSCTYYECSGGECVGFALADRQPCGTSSSDCSNLECLMGVCTSVPARIGEACVPPVSQPCYSYRCNSSGLCDAIVAPDFTPCNGGGTLCTPLSCVAGECVPVPVDCSAYTTDCGGPGVCNEQTGKCGPSWSHDCTPGPNAPCCTPLGSPGFCNWTLAGSNCTPVGADVCTQYACDGAGRCIGSPVPDGTDCASYMTSTKGISLHECRYAVCSQGVCTVRFYNGTPCASVAAGECSRAVCNGLGGCVLVPHNSGAPCSEATSDDCNTGICVGLACASVPRLSIPGVSGPLSCSSLNATDCAVPQCNAQGACVLVPLPDNITCTSLQPDDCNTPVCVAGACTLVPRSQGTSCSIPVGECQAAQCDGLGNCVAVPNVARVNTSCDALFGECLQALCDLNGLCSPAPLPQGSSCTLPDVPECQAAQCDGNGQCRYTPINENSLCTRDIFDQNLCNEYRCRSGLCVPVPAPVNASCSDDNQCDLDLCDGNGTCVHTQVVFCTSPPGPSPDCYQAVGTCLPDGSCVYFAIQEPVRCSPPAGQENSNCDYRCSAGDCIPVCQQAICGNGIVEPPTEQCDWAQYPTPVCCNASNCFFDAVNTTCNFTASEAGITDETKIFCYRGLCSATGTCVAVYDESIDGCSLEKSDRAKTAIIASVVTAGVLALLIAAAAVTLWRIKQHKLEKAWLEEFLAMGNVTVVNSPAFVESNLSIASPAFDPDAK